MRNALGKTSLVAVVGSGAMGAGIAQVAAAAGHTVKLYDTRPEAVQKAIAGIRKTFGMLAEKGRMTPNEAADAGGRLMAAGDLNDLADAQLVIEAIVENLDVKRQLFADLEKVVAADCILATNTSSISVTALAAKLALPSRFVGMHFFNPVPLMALVEVISGLGTDAQVASRIFDTAIAWGKVPVHAKSTPGFIVNRVARPYYAEALRLLNEQAASVATIDAVMREAGGFRMGPFELMDMIGHDVNFAVTQSVFSAYFNDPRFTPSLVQQELVNAGFLGRKSGRGFYRYDDGSKPEPVSEDIVAQPKRVTVSGHNLLIDALVSRARAAGVTVTLAENAGDDAMIQCDNAVLLVTDGRSATQRAVEHGTPNLVLLDLALDYGNATRLAVTMAEQSDPQAYRAVVGFLQSAGYAVSRLADVPGMAVMRTVAMLANEAADAVNQGVCDAADVDIAMQKGVNYPRGPLAWADSIGLNYVVRVLDNLAQVYGEDRYRVSPLLQKKVWSGKRFH
ncbi:3-hydroxyacyl-CoA dehydrogenase PaaH [Glaciimonas immobilis]|uniref:3-hydroxybutyryl-CoA dehydrogenase n=1 Tax=Glaciimonas immobilis TaxID=728004 RepID=A0A840RQA9_9BURK|nr:3-hydroxyacyl-CoA dehydrogenase PaaH [Glaciimonas immobilis]KAF3997080.1 3-hydroxyacyl-CoA dehydrogenase PaaC [Glaciimonas immobilis]MBB5199935.1 3-hydroxybutyryl-CoA dehydrogenase [Glaciimonas immobilis]